MDEKDYAEDLCSRMDKVKVTEETVEVAKSFGWKPQNLATTHTEGCECTHCAPVGPEYLQKQVGGDPRLVVENYNEYQKSQYPQQSRTPKETFYKGMSPDKMEQYKEFVTATDKCLPPLSHDDGFCDQASIGKALDSYYNFLKEETVETSTGVDDSGKQLEGILVFYVNVGSLPSDKAEAFVDKMEEKVKKDLENRLPPTWMTLWMPTRDQATQIQVLRLDGK